MCSESSYLPLVSVIVPVYNDASFVKGCCRQLSAQTLSPIEIILVDDGSTDRSAMICDRMEHRYANARTIHQGNLGVSVARNVGTLLARGAYVAYVDVDDKFDEDMLEYEYGIAVREKADVVCLEPERTGQPGEVTVIGGREAIGMLLRKRISMSCCNKLFREGLFSAGVFPAGTRIHEDLAAMYKVFCLSDRVACVNAAKYHYVHRESSSSRAKVFTEKYFDGIKVIDSIADDVHKRWPSLSDEAEARRAAVYLRISKIYWLRGFPSEHRARIESIKDSLRRVPKGLVRRYFTINDRIRLGLYLHCFPAFALLLRTIDRN